MDNRSNFTCRWWIFNTKIITMFNLFKKKTETEKLNAQYKKLLEEAHKLSTTNRKLSDNKVAEANEILNQIELLKSNTKL